MSSIEIPDPPGYRVVAYRPPKKGEFIRLNEGGVHRCKQDFFGHSFILELVEVWRDVAIPDLLPLQRKAKFRDNDRTWIDGNLCGFQQIAGRFYWKRYECQAWYERCQVLEEANVSTVLIDTTYDATVTRDAIALSLKIISQVYRKLADEAATARINIMGITPIGGTNPDRIDLNRADRLGTELFAVCLRVMESESRRPFHIHQLLRDCDHEHRLSDYVEAERQVKDALDGLLPRAEAAR